MMKKNIVKVLAGVMVVATILNGCSSKEEKDKFEEIRNELLDIIDEKFDF